MWAVVAGAVRRKRLQAAAKAARQAAPPDFRDTAATAGAPKAPTKFAPRDTQPISDALAGPGQLRLLDFTPKQATGAAAAAAAAGTGADVKAAAAGAGAAAVAVDGGDGSDSGRATVRVVQWNIERGLQIHGIIHELLRLQPDIVILQELDVLCDRTHGLDVPAVLGAALRMRVVFAAEFVEIKHKRRLTYAHVGQGGGVHGNAILTRLPVLDVWCTPHAVVPFDWERKGLAIGEPRKGRRVAVGMRVRTPLPHCPQLLVYCAHLENNCGIVGRYQQFAEILTDISARQKHFAQAHAADAHAKADAKAQGAAAGGGAPIPVVLGGDLNTIVGGLASLRGTYYDVLANKLFCTATNEAEYWDRVLLRAETEEGLPYCLRYHFVAHDALRDPWHKRRDVTVRRTLLGVPFYTAKLDWLLFSRALHDRVHSKAVGGEQLSDHNYLFAEIR